MIRSRVLGGAASPLGVNQVLIGSTIFARSPSFQNCPGEGFVLHSGMCITIYPNQLLSIICSSVNRLFLIDSAWDGGRLIFKNCFNNY